MKNIFWILLATISLFSCSKYEQPAKGMMDKYYHVKVDGIALIVRVAGKEDAKTALVMTHGGPGGSSQTFRWTKGIRNLEKDFKIIYWDQRASGLTQGKPSKSQITIEQYAKDLDAIIEFTKQKVGAESVFLLGHSWGGGLTAFYLTEDVSRQNKLKGYINVSGAYNVPGGLSASRQWIINGANDNISKGKKVSYWQGALRFYEKNPQIVADNFVDHAKYLGELKGGKYTDSKIQDSYMPAYELSAFLQNPFFVGHNITYKGNSVYTHLDLTSELHKIKIPTYIIWGKHDGLLPPHRVPGDASNTALYDDFIAHVGTSSNQLHSKMFNKTAHEPMAEEGEEFARVLSSFLKRYE